MRNKLYYIGFLRHGNKLILQATTDRDCLSNELIEYYGPHITTKKYLKLRLPDLLTEMNKKYMNHFKSIQLW